MKMWKCNRKRLAGVLILSILLGYIVIAPADRIFGDETESVTGVENDTEDTLSLTPGSTEEEPGPSPESDRPGEEGMMPVPEPGAEGELSPAPEEPGNLTPKPTGEAEKEDKPNPTPDITEEKPTEAPDMTGEEPTKTPDMTEEEPTKTPDITGEDVTPTPKPTKAPEPTEEPTKAPEATEEITPSPTPTIKPSAQVPTESNDARYQYLFGTDAQVYTIDNPPAGYENAEAAAKHMKTITVPVWKIDSKGNKYSSSFKLTIHEKLAKNVKAIFNEIYALDIKFPIRVLKGYGYRKVGGVGLSNSTLISIHSFGAAIDINPWDEDNDYFLGKGNDLRDKSNPYCIPDEVIEIFEKYGWFWGGNFEICSDTMHFQYLGLEFLTYQDNSPFRTLKVKSTYMKGTDVRNLQQRLCELGYKVSVDGVYGNKTASAVKKYQKQKGLKATGVVDYETWETIINETHYMPYAF